MGGIFGAGKKRTGKGERVGVYDKQRAMGGSDGQDSRRK